jgi:hypothetical protein
MLVVSEGSGCVIVLLRIFKQNIDLHLLIAVSEGEDFCSWRYSSQN